MLGKKKIDDTFENIESNKIFICVPFSEKDESKKLGALWAKSNKLWYIPYTIKKEYEEELKKKFNIASKSIIYLNIPYDNRNDAKSHGCKWDILKKKWYIPRDCSKDNFNYLSNKY